MTRGGAIIAILFGLAMLGGCADEKAAQVKEAVAAEFRDPHRAKFSDVREANGRVCGFVVGRRADGGWNSRKRFVARDPENVLVEMEPTTHSGSEAVKQWRLLFEDQWSACRGRSAS